MVWALGFYSVGRASRALALRGRDPQRVRLRGPPGARELLAPLVRQRARLIGGLLTGPVRVPAPARTLAARGARPPSKRAGESGGQTGEGAFGAATRERRAEAEQEPQLR